MSEQYKILHPVKYFRDHLAHKIRPDGREFGEYRPIVVNLGSISTADGSAIAKVGRTTVVCGIKAELCQPKAEAANEGFLIPNVELPPLCSSKFRPGPPTEQAQVATQLVADILKNSDCLDLKTLCIFPDKLAWCLYADLICLDLDGALIDACVVALMAALKSVTLPAVQYDPALDNKQVNVQERKALSVTNTPIATTFAMFDDKILIDPTVDEEDLSTSLVTIVVKEEELCFVHKPGGCVFTEEQLLKCVEESTKRATVIEEIIETAFKSL
ncbi:exosome complex component RRP43 [Tribolium castaneum]|uniref:Ribosomal RNA-processing protein 43 n=1 Tax=Tribolium castaneum TaxID=7070 RepID=D2A0W4_TRICA|nr:PREDICTED: exosome complex component RRP43 [Tribolium castaneum]EFA02571.1 Exosome complex component RRP43-like Protein [Tribolium castaneum]|eukprot:XP_972667.1 PREDICTED: exosome complex component RRP43 [Tribolium castaneum]